MAGDKKNKKTIMMPKLTKEIGDQVSKQRDKVKKLKKQREASMSTGAATKVKKVKPAPKKPASSSTAKASSYSILGTKRKVADQAKKKRGY